MNLNLSQVIPHPLKEADDISASEVWNKSSLSITTPERILISAPSGKGKSTLLNILYGVRKDYDGILSMNEQSMTNASEEIWNKRRKEDLSMVFQGLELFDHLTALENVNLKNEITSYKSELEISNMFDLLGIQKLKDQKTKTLSFGQKQRVAIIRSLCQPYKWLLLDEPFSHLDSLNSKIALDLIIEESDKLNAGIILTSLDSIETTIFTKSLTL